MIAVTVFIVLRQYLGEPQALMKTLGDTDDATRLVQVRELIAGAGWFDTTLARFGGETPLVSHWSRLIDLPLALLMSLLRPLFGTAGAELAVRILWPSLMLALLLRLMLHEAYMRSGQAGALLMLAFSVTAFISLFQFNLGRVDHHNVMILCAVGGLVMLARAFEDTRAGYPAGALLGLGLAVGYEGIAIVLPAVAVAGLAAVVEPRWLEGVKRAAVAMAGVLTLALLATIAPSQWFAARCDALSLNIVLLIGAGAAGLLLVASRFVAASVGLRLGVLATAGLAGVSLYAAFDPVCLGGPFAQVDPAVKPIWLDRVTETHNVLRLARTVAPAAAVVIIFFLLGVAAQAWRWHKKRTIESTFLLVVMIAAAILGLWQVKFLPYASWLACLALAVVVAEIGGWRTLSALTVRLAAAVFCSQTTIGAIAEPIMLVAGTSKDAIDGTKDANFDACRSSQALTALDAVPAGLVAADIDFGPFIVANTQHRVIAAPYHRIDKAILAIDRIQKAQNAVEAEQRLRAAGAAYVFACIPKPKAVEGGNAMKPAKDPKSFFDHLKAGTAYPFLEPVTLGEHAGQIRLWRVMPMGR